MNEYMNIAYKEALKAYKNDEIPVGAIIVKNNKIISKGYNQKEKYKNVTEHAEIIAIRKASKKLKNWRLNDCIMYVTLEPCMMCTGAILQSRISKVVYILSNPNSGYLSSIISNQIIVEQIYDNNNIYKNLLKSFFESKRK